MGALQKAFTNPVFSETNSMSIRKTLVAAPLALAIFAALSGCSHQAQPAPEAQPAQPPIPQIGGEPVVKLTRPATSNGQQMEFLSATVFPDAA